MDAVTSCTWQHAHAFVSSCEPLFFLNCCSCTQDLFPFHFMRAHAVGRAEAPKLASQEILLGIARQSGFWVAQQGRDCSTTLLLLLVVRLLPSSERLEYDYLAVDRAIGVRLLRGGCNGTANIFLHQLWTTTSNNSSWWMMGWTRWCLRHRSLRHRSLRRVYLHVPLFIYWFSSLVNQ
jgi:hypothetical protein